MPVSISGTTGYAGPLGAITVDTGSIVNNAVTPAKMSRTGTAGQVLTSGGAGADPSYQTVSGGVTSITAGGGLTGGTITSTGTIAIDTTFLAVGSYAILFNYSDTTVAGNSTAISSSQLGYVSSASGGNYQGAQVGAQHTRAGNVTVPGAGVAGYATTTAVSGTWRCLSGARGRNYDPCGPTTTAYQGLFVRVS